jgi:hypothetical protein
MTTFTSPRIVIAFSAIAVSMSAVVSAAPGSKSADLLTVKQVNELMLTTNPADHVTLQKHFLAVAAKYDAEAVRHAELALADRTNPNRGSHFPGNRALRARHCERLSAALRDDAREARTLAAQHERMAIAITQSDHVTLQQYFLAVAAKYDAEAATHSDSALSYRKNWNVGSHVPGSALLRARHCERLAASIRETASKARDLAAEHGRMASAQ